MDVSKQDKRRESKLKKAKAFLELVGYSRDESPKEMETDTHAAIAIAMKSTDQSSEDEKHEAQKKALPADVFLEMKKIIREKNKQAMQKPKLFLTLENLAPARLSNDEMLPPLYLLDLQHLLLYALQGNVSRFKPRWCKLLRVMKVSSVVLLCLDGLSYQEVLDEKDSFDCLSQSFHTHVEMVCPEQYNSSTDAELLSVPLSISQLKKTNQKVPAQIKNQIAAKLRRHDPNENVSRLCLLLSSHQMKTEGYPMPVMTREGKYRDFVFSMNSYTQVTNSSPLFAVDCEMCMTTAGRNELTRVSIVTENGEVVYDTLVKPRNKITNYLTQFSGITKDMIDPVVTVLKDVQRDIKELLPNDAILCGQSLNSDLIALQIFHPYVIDTSVIYNMSGNRQTKAGLRKLSSFFLGRNIQNSRAGHDSAEDAMATLDLVKLKLTKGLEFGDATISGVYFPSVESYFLGEDNGKKMAAQNLEEDNADDNVTRPYGYKHQLASDFLLKTSEESSKPESKRGQSSMSSTASDSDDDDSSHSRMGNVCKKPKLSDEESNEHLSLSTSNDNAEVSVSTNESKPLPKVPWMGTEQQEAIFSQENSVHVSNSFFKVVHDSGRSSCFLGSPSLCSKFKGEPIETVSAANDSEVRKCAKAMVQSKEFLWAYFSEYRDAFNSGKLTDETKQKLRRKLDCRVRSVIKKVKENSLVILVTTGRQHQDENVSNAGVFVKIT